jgi:hypothetical protein
MHNVLVGRLGGRGRAHQSVSRRHMGCCQVGLAYRCAEKGGRVRTALALPAARPGAPTARP